MTAALNGTKKTPPPSAKARRLLAVPYFAQKLPIETIAGLFRVSESTVKKWAQHPDVRRALGEVGDAIVSQTAKTAEDLVRSAFAALADLLSNAEDERTRLEAAKTVLDRFGHPASTKHEGGPTTAPVLVSIRVEEAERVEAFVKGGDGDG